MTIYPIEAGNFKLDGGAMFGVVPKSLWQRTNPSDANNMISMSMRLVSTDAQSMWVTAQFVTEQDR